jgi:hypothetical protein
MLNSPSWLENFREIPSPEQNIANGYADLEEHTIAIFPKAVRSFVENRLQLGPNIIIPLRSISTGLVSNLIFRALSPDLSDISQKCRLLPGFGGWSDADNNPLVYGIPSISEDYSFVIITEGMLDTFAAEALLIDDDKCLIVGATSASSLPKITKYLANQLSIPIIIIHHLDHNENNLISYNGVGQKFAIEAAKTYQSQNRKAYDCTNGPAFLKEIKKNIFTLGDSFKDAREFIEAAGQLEIKGKYAGKKSAMKKQNLGWKK